MVQQLIVTTSSDPFIRGLDYLYGVRSLALVPEMVGVVDDLAHRGSICTWIGDHIDRVNSQLNAYLQMCHDCFHLQEQRSIQIFAAPLVRSFEIDGFCNLQTNPITILIDVGQVVPEDWLRLVVHEYAHAHAGFPGHHSQFGRSLAHLCLGLEIPFPLDQPDHGDWLRFYPDCVATQDSLAFWRGEEVSRRSLN
ncbi:hypothetical protein [Leptolyngbya sp. Cla-17]|uniref:hypothetical protein n=1 Tax=Leptolyngbya sp. Cla-17 TaxID=2803751 RepID=UPI001492DD3E|nr:hypothetical protein [Leptolyngbya sp. Cla-17]